MRRTLLGLVLAVFSAWAVNTRLYMTDGSYHVVREYQVSSDRVRFYSVERSDWEEIPLALVDLKRTETEAAERKAELDREVKSQTEEEAAERAIVQETSRIPQDPGVYWLDGKEAKALKAAESTLHTNKGRSVLARLSPIPVISGKATLEIQGTHSEHVFDNPDQEFYIQLFEEERFGILKLTPKGQVRIVENLTTLPVVKEVQEEPQPVEILQQQLSPDGLYKIWAKEPLAPGEYAVVEFTEGKMNMQIWDFAIKAKAK